MYALTHTALLNLRPQSSSVNLALHPLSCNPTLQSSSCNPPFALAASLITVSAPIPREREGWGEGDGANKMLGVPNR